MRKKKQKKKTTSGCFNAFLCCFYKKGNKYLYSTVNEGQFDLLKFQIPRSTTYTPFVYIMMLTQISVRFQIHCKEHSLSLKWQKQMNKNCYAGQNVGQG